MNRPKTIKALIAKLKRARAVKEVELTLTSFWTIEEAALRWRSSYRTVSDQFRQGHVPGALKIDGKWRCPAGTKKPKPKRGRPVEKRK